MTQAFDTVLRLAACGAVGKPAGPLDSGTEWDKLLELGAAQGVLPLMAAALAPTPGVPQDVQETLSRVARRAAINYHIRRNAARGLLASLSGAGIPAVLLKGFTLAELYHLPEARPFGDIDLYVAPQDEKRAAAVLIGLGLVGEKRPGGSHHALFLHPKAGRLELHVRLHDDVVEQVWFRNARRDMGLKESFRPGMFPSLGPTDGLIFLVTHMAKHFISGGASIVQFLDIGLYLKSAPQGLDMNRLGRVLSATRCGELYRAGLCLLERTGCFGPYDKVREAAVTALGGDIEAGGWLGGGETGHISRRLTRARESLRICALIRDGRILLRRLFPSRAELNVYYPGLCSRRWMLPLAWLRRLARLALFRREAPVPERDRENVFETLGMM